ncbi:MAG: secondary thiamine-phosphate synthase enzyme YjbQ [Ignavibacteria bacterium]|jgi:secondary thiamine-phosphate synthase enzyme
MKIVTHEIQKKTKGNCDIIDITNNLNEIIMKSDIKDGICTVFSVGSTAGITTIEYEPGLLKDIPKLLDKLIPSSVRYNHDDTWGDGNGHAHLRSALFKTSLTIPVVKRELTLGTWQQVVLIDFDNRSRTRRVVVQVLGE